MAITVSRPKLNWSERLYLPAILSGMAITLKHFKNMLAGRTKVTMQYPERNGQPDAENYAARQPSYATTPAESAVWPVSSASSLPAAGDQTLPAESRRRPVRQGRKFPNEFDSDMILISRVVEELPRQAIYLRKIMP